MKNKLTVLIKVFTDNGDYQKAITFEDEQEMRNQYWGVMMNVFINEMLEE